VERANGEAPFLQLLDEIVEGVLELSEDQEPWQKIIEESLLL
jgi:hypothetical protein